MIPFLMYSMIKIASIFVSMMVSIETTKPLWKYIKIDVEEECPVRRSYHPKHCPHLYFDEGEYVGMG